MCVGQPEVGRILRVLTPHPGILVTSSQKGFERLAKVSAFKGRDLWELVVGLLVENMF